MYRWIVFLHVASVFMFLLKHGTEMAVTFKFRKQTAPASALQVFMVMAIPSMASSNSQRLPRSGAFAWSAGLIENYPNPRRNRDEE